MAAPPPLPALAQTCAIAVIAKAPRPGHVKTRLQGLLTAEEAAAMGAAFLQDTLENLVEAGRHVAIAPFVAYAPAGQEARFDGMLPPGVELILADGAEGDGPGVEGFGRVLLHTTRALLGRGYGAACVLGADSPTAPTGQLVRAAEALLGGRAEAALGLAEDGGYWLLGLTEPRAEAYSRIAWSTERAGADTLARLAEAGLRTEALATWYDVDDPPALARLVREAGVPGEAYAAPRTGALVRDLGLAGRVAGG